MNIKKDIELRSLKKQIRNLKLIVYAILLGICAFFILSFNSTNFDNKYLDELTVGTLNIAGPDSLKRMVLTHQIGDAPFNNDKIKRSVPPSMAGMIYLNPNGDEIGGIGWAGDESRTFALNALDYTGVPLEAIGLSRVQTENSHSARLLVMDNPRKSIKMDRGR